MTLIRSKAVPAADLHRRWLNSDVAYRREFAAQESEFALASAMIEARARAGLTQQELAERMRTNQATVARLESGRVKPSTRTLERLARATGTRLRVSFEPVEAATASRRRRVGSR